MKTLSASQILYMTSYDTTNNVHEVLHRAGVKHAISVKSAPISKEKVYEKDQVWQVLGNEILSTAERNPDVKNYAWEVFNREIKFAAVAQDAKNVFADYLK